MTKIKFSTVFLLFLCLQISSCGKTFLEETEEEKERTEQNPSPASEESSSASDGSYTPDTTGKGELENPLTVAEFIKSSLGDRDVWVCGYIVGDCTRAIKNAEWTAPFSYDTAVLIADVKGETDPEKVMSVQLITSSMKNEIGLKSNPQNHGRKMMIRGQKQIYLGIFGIKKFIMGYYLL